MRACWRWSIVCMLSSEEGMLELEEEDRSANKIERVEFNFDDSVSGSLYGRL